MGEGLCLKYLDIDFKPKTMAVLRNANIIIDEYRAQGYVLTLRQLFYQFVARDLLPNSQSQYARLGDIISDGRLAGVIPWDAIEDRGRALKGLQTYSHPSEAIENAKNGYRIDMWTNQDWRPEVWVEKLSLESVLAGICNKLRVNFFATKGYNSQSEQWAAGQRFQEYVRRGQRPIVFHLGDHDPSGIDMTRDAQERLSLFAGVPIIVQRLALNMPQVEQYDPPPNPLKLRADGEHSDSRAAAYVKKYGNSSWELDALSPDVIQALIADAIGRIRDEDKWSEMEEQETDDIRMMEDAVNNMDPMGQED